MQTTVSNLDIRNNKKTIETMAAIILLSATMLVVFVNSGLSVVCGPIMAVLFTYLFFTGYHEFVTAVILSANDALGTVLMGRLSFVYFLLFLVIIKMLCRIKLSTKRLMFLLVSMAFLAQLLVVDYVEVKMLVYTFIYLVSLITVDFDGDEDAMKRFFAGVAFSVVLIAIHAMLTGGVEYYELSSSAKRQDDFVRKGILGVGIGNSNYSGILLNLGTICLWCFTRLNNWIKALCMVPILYAMLLTNSMSALIGLGLIAVSGVLLGKNKRRGIIIIVLIAVALIIAYNAYVNLPAASRNVELDHYIERIEETIDEVRVGDFSGATTHRSDLVVNYLRYIFKEQSFIKMLFGGNPLSLKSVSEGGTHNTFINLLLQFGFVGTVVFLGLVIANFIKCFKNKSGTSYKGIIVLKIMCVFAGCVAGLHTNNLWAFWMLALVLL